MKILLQKCSTEKYIKFTNNKEDLIKSDFTYIYVEHNTDIENVLNIILPFMPFIKNENKLIYGLYGFLPYLIEKLNLINEPYFNLKFIENDEYLNINFNKLFERKSSDKCFNITYSITINCNMTLTNFRTNKELLISQININKFNDFNPGKIITIQKNNNDDYFVFSDKIIHILLKMINRNNIFYQ